MKPAGRKTALPKPGGYAKKPSMAPPHIQDPSRAETGAVTAKKAAYAALFILTLFMLYLLSRVNYLLFHTIAEGFSIIVAGAIFVIAWNTRQLLANHFLLFLGIAYLFVGCLDFFHTISYDGMAIIRHGNRDSATQLWIAARFLESLSMPAAFIFLKRRLNAPLMFSAYTLVSIFVVVSVFSWHIFPLCFVPGTGTTLFKNVSEYIISAAVLAFLGLLLHNRRQFDTSVFRWLFCSGVLSIASELAFTVYLTPYDLANLVGHYLKILSFVCIYKAIVETGLRRPYALFFRELKESENRYRFLFTTMFEGFARHEIVLNENGEPVDYIFLEVNPAFERLTGLRKENIIGRQVTEVLPGIEKDPADWINVFGRVAATGEPVHFENYAAPVDQWYSVSAYSPQKNQFVAVFQNITERKQNEAALQEANEELESRVRERTRELVRSKELFQTVIENIPVMICLFGAEGEVKILNTHLRRLVSGFPEELENNDRGGLCTAQAGICREAWSYVKSRDPAWRDITITLEDGETMETSWASVSLSDGSVIGIGIDITERKQAEKRNALYLKHLERSNQALQDFAFAASHDLQEPLRKIQTFGDLLLDEFAHLIPEEGRDYLSRMRNAATRMRTLIDSLLAYSRVNTHREPLSEVDLADALKEALANLHVSMEETGAAVEAEDLPVIYADRVQMVQLFQNLVGNALKFRSKGTTPRVLIQSRKVRKDAATGIDTYEIRVKDNGIGFDEKYLSRIFTPFQRLHGKSAYKGVGMGLAICNRIVEHHQGRLTAESRPGEGATFIITLPSSQTEEDPPIEGPGYGRQALRPEP